MKSPAEMSNEEIRRELNYCRIALESIRPFAARLSSSSCEPGNFSHTCRDISRRQSNLRAELDSRVCNIPKESAK